MYMYIVIIPFVISSLMLVHIAYNNVLQTLITESGIEGEFKLNPITVPQSRLFEFKLYSRYMYQGHSSN